MMYELTKDDYCLIGDVLGIPLAIGKHSGVVYRLDEEASPHSESGYVEFHPYWDSKIILRMLAMMMEDCPDDVVELFSTHKQWEDTMNSLIMKTWLTWKKENVK
jgi:hypothetical protein